MEDTMIDVYKTSTKSELLKNINKGVLGNNNLSLLIEDSKELFESLNREGFTTISFLENAHHGTPFKMEDIDRRFYVILSENLLHTFYLKSEVITEEDKEYNILLNKLKGARFSPI
ncbi:MAG: hypothetical protein AABW67_02240 [Nanoarchaeota archaeon]